MNNSDDQTLYIMGVLTTLQQTVNQQSKMIKNQQAMIDKQSELIELIHKESVSSEKSSQKAFMISCISLGIAIFFGFIQTVVLFL